MALCNELAGPTYLLYLTTLCSDRFLMVAGFLPPGNHREGEECAEATGALATYPVLTEAEVRWPCSLPLLKVCYFECECQPGMVPCWYAGTWLQRVCARSAAPARMRVQPNQQPACGMRRGHKCTFLNLRLCSHAAIVAAAIIPTFGSVMLYSGGHAASKAPTALAASRKLGS